MGMGFCIEMPKTLSELSFFLDNYSRGIYSNMEIKLTDAIVDEKVMETLGNFLTEHPRKIITFRLFDNVLIDFTAYFKTLSWLSLFEKKCPKKSSNLVIKFEGEEQPSLDNVLKKYNIIIENVIVTQNLIGYLVALKRYAVVSEKRICLNLGNLLYSIEHCKENPDKVIKFILNDSWWSWNVAEVRLHDYTEEQLIAKMGSGKMDLYEIIKRFRIFLDKNTLFEGSYTENEKEEIIRDMIAYNNAFNNFKIGIE